MRRDVTRSDQSMLEKMMEYLDCYFMKGPQVLPTKIWIIDLTTHRENSKTWKPCVCTSFWHVYSSIYRQTSKDIITKSIYILYMGVSKNRGPQKSSILIGFSIINHPFWDTTIFGNTHIYIYVYIFFTVASQGSTKVTAQRVCHHVEHL